MLSSFSFSKDTVGFLIEGVMDEDAMDKLHERILEKQSQFDKINLYLEDADIERFTMPAIVSQLMFKLEHSKKFRKVALVTDRKWIHLCGSLENMFLGATVKSFDTEDRMDAMSWIAQRDR